jgi:hypothetical protein
MLVVVCRDGDDLLKIPPNERIDRIDEDTSPLRTPFKSKWLTPIIQSAVLDTPGVIYGNLREILKQYGNNYAITDSILQIGRDIAKNHFFGLAATRRQVLTAVSSVVLSKELARMKKLKQTMIWEERKKCVFDWKQENEVFLSDTLGFETGPQYRFLAGILFAPSSSKVIVPQVQDVIQADGAHTSFGKYTLLSAYGTMANGNMSLLAFGIMFGNKDTGNWTKFWEFVKEIHPSVNAPTITILTDQDKGSITSISATATLPEAHQFNCSYHRHQNIIKACRGPGKTPLTALWMYNLLCGSNSLSQLNATQEKFYPQMHPTDLL